MPFLKESKYDLPRSRKLENLTLKNGIRKTIFNTVGDKYAGQWKNNEKEGKGTLLTRNSELYEGDFHKNYRHGFGVLSHKLPDCDVYTLDYRGEWKNGKMHGRGLRIYPNGGFYVGHFKNGKRHGYGQEYTADHDFYDGDWFNDVKQGLGMFVRSDGNRYEGQWKDGKKNGQGILFHLDSGQMQEGFWADDICVTSKICDITYRQAAVCPSKYPIKPATYVSNIRLDEMSDIRSLSVIDNDACHMMKGDVCMKLDLMYLSERPSTVSVYSRNEDSRTLLS